MKTLAIILSNLILLIPQPSLAENWVRIDERSSIDTDSILVGGSDDRLRVFWSEYTSPTASEILVKRVAVNCISGEYAIMERVLYSPDGSVLIREKFTPENSPSHGYAVPGTLRSEIHEFVCNFY